MKRAQVFLKLTKKCNLLLSVFKFNFIMRSFSFSLIIREMLERLNIVEKPVRSRPKNLPQKEHPVVSGGIKVL